MCTVYQVVGISIGARGCTPSLSSSTRSLFPSLSLSLSVSIFFPISSLVYFLRAYLFASPPWMRVFFLPRRDLRPFRVFNIIRGSSIIPTIERTEVGLRDDEEGRGREGVFYPRRCYKLFRIVKNSRWTGDSAGRTYGIFHYGSSFALFFSIGAGGRIFQHLAGKNFNAQSYISPIIHDGFENHRE